ncbi:MAG TPA: hypothetical protein VF128_06265 [Gemmatimonadaceae bacterium]
MSQRSRTNPFLIPLVLISVTLADPIYGGLQAQRINVNVRHQNDLAGVIDFDQGKSVTKPGGLPSSLPDLEANPGDSICIAVRNAHSVFYAYSLETIVDTTKESLPVLTPLVALLRGQLPPGVGAEGRVDPNGVADPAVKEFHEIFSPLSIQIAIAQDSVRLSDDPDLGITLAKRAVRTISNELPDAAPDAWFDRNKPKTPVDSMVRVALRAYGRALIAARKSLKTTYAPNAAETVVRCAAVGTGKTTIKLRIKKSAESGARFTSDNALSVVVQPRYQRSAVEGVAGILLGFVRNVPSFSVTNGVVAVDSSIDSRITRPGGFVVMNLVRQGPYAIGPALGVGIGSDGKPARSDLLLGAIASYKDLLRIGVGFGTSKVTIGLKDPAAAGQPLPNGAKLDDLLVQDDRRAWYILVAIPALQIKSPF